jgi:glycosyltransferase involved in cell wall biosynthesis
MLAVSRIFFEEGKMGFTLESNKLSYQKSVEKIKKLILNQQLINQISQYNISYAKKRFFTNVVSKRLEKILSETVLEAH